VEYVDDASGKKYYHCAASNVTRWDKPPGFWAAAVGATGGGWLHHSLLANVGKNAAV